MDYNNTSIEMIRFFILIALSQRFIPVDNFTQTNKKNHNIVNTLLN
jgi:hypothetical protein